MLNRLTFGPRPGEVERVMKMGIGRWIDRQLHPESIADGAGMIALKGCSHWVDPIETAAAFSELRTASMGGQSMLVQIVGFQLATRDSARRSGAIGSIILDAGQLIACRLARVESSDQQLLEVMTDFWMNHFSIYGGRLPATGMLIDWDRSTIRPNALGRFRELLGAVARSPAMLFYLDNAANGTDPQYPTLAEYVFARRGGTGPINGGRTGLNENYARELLELHTLGVDGGYTEADVIGVARALTGWTLSTRPKLSRQPYRFTFAFDTTRHDAGAKSVLGLSLAEGRGLEDGEQVLDLLARHPSTARFIARKLAVRFVSDAPPDALVERAAATFLRTDGDIREVVRTILTSPEFHSPDVYRAKVKSPLELVLSARRALAAPVDTAAEVIDLLIALDQPPFGKRTPEGWPETGAGWMNAGAMLARLRLAMSIANEELPSIPLEAWPAWSELAPQSIDVQADGVIARLLNGSASPALRAEMLAYRPAGDPDSPEVRARTLRHVVALALGSPEFQRR